MQCRPAYRRLSSIRQNHPNVPILALTATAVQRYVACQPIICGIFIVSDQFLRAMSRVRDDIVTSLNLRSPEIHMTSFNRPNIYYEGKFKCPLHFSLS